MSEKSGPVKVTYPDGSEVLGIWLHENTIQLSIPSHTGSFPHPGAVFLLDGVRRIMKDKLTKVPREMDPSDDPWSQMHYRVEFHPT
jgi:hypothetical protein